MAKKKVNSEKHAYLTKRILVSSARTAGIKASKEAMQLMGYVVISENIQQYRLSFGRLSC